MWLSINPGTTARPRRSILRVAGPAICPICWLVPTAITRSPFMATAWAIVNFSSTVMILPLVRMKSGADCWARVTAPAQKMARTAPAATVRIQRVKVGRT